MSRVKKWTREELYEMTRLYPTFFNKALAELFGRSPKAVAVCAARLGLKKSEAFIEGCKQLPGRFQKGHIPHNKGARGKAPKRRQSLTRLNPSISDRSTACRIRFCPNG